MKSQSLASVVLPLLGAGVFAGLATWLLRRVPRARPAAAIASAPNTQAAPRRGYPLPQVDPDVFRVDPEPLVPARYRR
ncbi:MAG TPA: hypothetical protein VER33_12955 [Polyangiaceae bacterium]|nr:hypothetical protein [Polyangiaceae bacterium]